MSPPPVSQLIDELAESEEDRVVFRRIAEATAREAVRYLAVGDSQEWAEDQVVQAMLGAEDTKK